ncbi:MAG: BamA/TamA family outer membrane protein, partial [Candidatus Binatia bacterium]
EHDDTTYELDVVRGRVQAEVHPGSGLMIGAAFRPLVGDVEVGRGAEPPIPETIDGFGGPIVIMGGGPVVEWDGRDDKVRPRWGPYLRAEGGLWKSTEGEAADGGDFEYARYTVEIEQHLPTFRPNRTIAIQAMLDRVEPRGGGAVPFWDLPALDEDHLLRGFKRNRFRDEGAVLFNVEYRWPIWDLWDGYLFLDEGQVFGDWADVDLERFEWSAGAGVRFYSSKSFLLRVQLAFSEEETKFRFGLSQEF